VRAACREAGHSQVALGHLFLDGIVQVREGAAKQHDRLLGGRPQVVEVWGLSRLRRALQTSLRHFALALTRLAVEHILIPTHVIRIPLCGVCGGMGIRTPDLLIANETLYQLSYTPTKNRSPLQYQKRRATQMTKTTPLRRAQPWPAPKQINSLVTAAKNDTDYALSL
jgi:hypothetical protein